VSAIEFTHHPYMVRILFVTNAKEWREQCEWYGWDVPYPRECNAAVARLPSKGHSPVVLVMANRARLRREGPAAIAQACAHEATHIMRYICENVGEQFLGWESEAHLVGAITKWMYKIVVDGAVN
jgi:hypothetical protein